MPVKSCRTKGKPGFKWGDDGNCFLYTPNDKGSRKRARIRATNQGKAIKAEKGKK